MPNDAKLGLVVGVGLVIVVAVIVFRKEAPPVAPTAFQVSAREHALGGDERVARRVQMVPVPGPIIGMSGMLAPLSRGGDRSHTVQEGDTLFSLATRYYGDREKWRALHRANSDRVPNPGRLPMGAVLIIPDPNDPIMQEGQR
jgi:nucleoid-associated protein YgaU